MSARPDERTSMCTRFADVATTGRAFDLSLPARLAEFYCALLGWQVVREDDDWVTIRGDEGTGESAGKPFAQPVAGGHATAAPMRSPSFRSR